jgi:hypothetical protein
MIKLLGAGAQALLLGVRADAEAVVRDPFWPVGYVHQDTTTVVVVTAPPVVIKVAPPVAAEPAKPDPLIIMMKEKELADKIRSKCQVSGFLKSGDGKQMAVVNGQVVGIGDRLPVTVENQTYNFKVTAVSATAVKLEPVQ